MVKGTGLRGGQTEGAHAGGMWEGWESEAPRLFRSRFLQGGENGKQGGSDGWEVGA